MKYRTAWMSAFFFALVLPVTAQTATENYLKAMDSYQAQKFDESRSLLLTAEQQLGDPKLKTTSMLILSTFKSNSFDSKELMDRIAVYGTLSKQEDEMTSEIRGIESTVKSWRDQLEAKKAAIIKNRDLAAAKTEAGTNYKMSDYNVVFRSLYQELSAVKASLGSSKLSDSDRLIVLETKKVVTSSRFGLEEDARKKLAELDHSFGKKVAEAGYPDSGVSLYRSLFGSGMNGNALEKGRADRLAKEEKARQDKQTRLARRQQDFLDNAAKDEAVASSASALGVLSVVGGIGCGALVLVSFSSILNSSSSGPMAGVLVGLGAGGAYAFAMIAPSQFRRAEDYRRSARNNRSRASQVSFSALPTFELDAEGGIRPGVAVAFGFTY